MSYGSSKMDDDGVNIFQEGYRWISWDFAWPFDFEIKNDGGDILFPSKKCLVCITVE